MPADLFPGFTSHWIDLPDGRFFARAGGPEDAPPLVLLHGFPRPMPAGTGSPRRSPAPTG